ncbi:hypothetical protein G6F57_007322 [Rhizopus arrhizus]|uniref:Osmotin, thaumatin-like protein n=1 Tax=Rhizopus oryzae TaxID=64495 RepID=A0A9P7BT16_RHIOR|nr:hypothetical protein G6F23_005477 [Rhizopus arrhizus]KAG1411571.1 hypothetical protein G6F58_008486 [Rhizopus delemar]KAG0778110.1 hypothetical protein G6F22_011431 [Rhizopus arrhizus]KAG0785052.1 hypothetical protein G6F21_009508 [Rhizopus arrhizus]KAG0817916.1 hypothetical protein G6F20_001984 [Rhizopus arrhizus]
MVAFSSFVSFLALTGMTAMAAPTNSVTLTVKNSCKSSLQINQLTNGGGDAKSSSVTAGHSLQISVPSNWGGRIWAREDCSGSSDCQVGAPASLAEFLLSGAAGMDYYDVSFVDGYNLPVAIAPNGKTANSAYKYECGAPACSSLPSCPEELQDKDSKGNVIGCKSACSAFGTPEYCCTGDYSTPSTCPANKYSLPVKNACPDVYTYAYDDTTSMYACASPQGYTVTFCP